MIRAVLTAGVVAASVFAGAAQAGVVYNWQPIASSPTIFETVGRLVLSDQAAQGGSVTYRNAQSGGQFQFADPAAPIEQFQFGVRSTPSDPLVRLTLDPRLLPAFSFIDVSFSATFDGGLAGFMRAGDIGTDVALSGTSALWTVADFNTDIPSSCQRGSCENATGRWVREVPEPDILPLLALGAFGVAASMRRRRS